MNTASLAPHGLAGYSWLNAFMDLKVADIANEVNTIVFLITYSQLRNRLPLCKLFYEVEPQAPYITGYYSQLVFHYYILAS
jgi:hypothetical protein